ncbi:MAG TPA: GNAT family N-acetyltransferase [Chloroflexota bacterium]|nr:GNAT family N-acetyltransferase [Chloroflexota bacterium]
MANSVPPLPADARHRPPSIAGGSEAESEVWVRPLAPGDLPALLALIDALADYEHLPRPDAAARARLARDATAAPPRFQALLAELGGRVVGYALYFETYSTFLALPTLYLEDLFVLPEARRHGAGSALFRACAREAVQRGCGRMEWQVLTWNQLALDFYARFAAAPLDDWRPHRLTGPALHRAATPSLSAVEEPEAPGC